MSQQDAMFHLRGLGPVSPTLGDLEDAFLVFSPFPDLIGHAHLLSGLVT